MEYFGKDNRKQIWPNESDGSGARFRGGLVFQLSSDEQKKAIKDGVLDAHMSLAANILSFVDFSGV